MVKTNPSGLVFDVHRFSLNDGPGIRSTIFLKGCPLNCQWCHNPESIGFKRQLSFDASACTNCGLCIDVCHDGVFTMLDNVLQVERAACTFCGDCVPACPEEALKVIGHSREVDELMALMVRDRDYYQESGGGVTVSGGEPMSQFDFTLALVKQLKQAGLQTCLDTSGLAPWKNYQTILPYVDLFLYDYKATGTDLHRKLTDVPDQQILQNMDALLKAGAKIILRCPMIPGVNDSEPHLRAIAELEQRYPELLGIEIMAYHRMGNEKGVRVGMTPTIEMPDASDELKEAWIATLQKHGSHKAIIG